MARNSNLLRKSIMIEDKVWKGCELLSSMQKKSISKLVNELLKKELEMQQESNVILRLKLALENVEYVSEEEEEDIMKSLSKLKPDDLKIVEEHEV